jgi:hypothetical protein
MACKKSDFSSVYSMSARYKSDNISNPIYYSIANKAFKRLTYHYTSVRFSSGLRKT